MLKCKEIVAQASDYLEHELSLQRRLQYRAHLLLCSNCRRFNRQFCAAMAMLRNVPLAPQAPHRIDAIKRKIDSLE
ncbi:MAG: zf-HC2 domain-containing protein [Motiliproteus sp.]